MNTVGLAKNAYFYFMLRVFLHKNRRLLRSAQILRAWFILGPLRELAVWYFRRYGRTQPIPLDRGDLFPSREIGPVVHSLNERGYANGWKVPDGHVDEIIRYANETRFEKYWNPHRECRAIDQIARNEKIVDIARQYLGAEPILWLTQLKWSFGEQVGQERDGLLRSDKEPIQYDGGAFHYDALDFKSLTIFIYLTDVDPSSGPHVLIENTHRTKSFREIYRIIMRDDVANQKFGSRIKTILGKKGTVLFEETSSFHKASRCINKRLMLSIDYVLRRTPPPERSVMA